MCQKKDDYYENLIRQADIDSEPEDPVFYCQHCLSLKIMEETKTNKSYCGACGNFDIMRTSIQLWEDLYQNEYGKKYLEHKEVQIFKKQINDEQ